MSFCSILILRGFFDNFLQIFSILDFNIGSNKNFNISLNSLFIFLLINSLNIVDILINFDFFLIFNLMISFFLFYFDFFYKNILNFINRHISVDLYEVKKNFYLKKKRRKQVI